MHQTKAHQRLSQRAVPFGSLTGDCFGEALLLLCPSVSCLSLLVWRSSDSEHTTLGPHLWQPCSFLTQFTFYFSVSETGLYYVVQAGLERVAILTLLPACWDCRHALGPCRVLARVVVCMVGPSLSHIPSPTWVSDLEALHFEYIKFSIRVFCGCPVIWVYKALAL